MYEELGLITVSAITFGQGAAFSHVGATGAAVVSDVVGMGVDAAGYID